MLRKRGQRILKAVHVVAAGAWLGALAAMVLVLAGHQTPGQSAGLDLAVYRIHEFILFYAFIATLVTGLLFSLFTQWGFFKHHWITSKWLLALVLFAITLLWQSPSLSGLAALSDAGLDHIHGYHHARYRLASLRLAAIQLAIVVVVFVISTLKPWGQWKRRVAMKRTYLIAAIAVLGGLGLAMGVWSQVRLHTYRTMTIADTNARDLADGIYRGQAHCDFDYVVDMRVAGGAIKDIHVVQNRDAHYARIAEAVLPRIIAAQNANVDAITGATTTSKCLMRAVQNAHQAKRAPASAR